MKQNVLQNVIGFISKYIWIFCALLIILELVSVTHTANILMQQSTNGIMQSVSGEVSGRVDGILRLLTGLSSDSRFADTSKPLFDRVIHAIPYQESYNLYMIALTDEDVNVVSTNTKMPPSENYSLSYRDYMQRLYSTGQYQITDAFLSGDNENTINYTIAVPIFKDDKVAGSVFGSIYFSDIEDILDMHSGNKGSDFYLLGAQNTLMAGDDETVYGKSFLDLSQNNFFFNTDAETINNSITAGESGNYWEWNEFGLTYVTYQQVAPTNWTLLYRVQFMSVFINLLPSLFIKICCYIIMCLSVFLFGKWYLNHHFAQVNHLLNRMASIQKELFQSEQTDYNNLLDLTQQGLSDQLTGLATRAVLFNKMSQLINAPNSYGTVVFIDLDDLKRINDSFGHEGGDCALLHFAKVLKEYEQKYNAVASRYGGDEFIFILDSVGIKEASEIVQNLCISLNTTIVTKGHSFAIHGSLGVSFYPNHGTKPEELICRADLALYSAKQNGKNQCVFFTGSTPLL